MLTNEIKIELFTEIILIIPTKEIKYQLPYYEISLEIKGSNSGYDGIIKDKSITNPTRSLRTN